MTCHNKDCSLVAEGETARDALTDGLECWELPTKVVNGDKPPSVCLNLQDCFDLFYEGRTSIRYVSLLMTEVESRFSLILQGVPG